MNREDLRDAPSAESSTVQVEATTRVVVERMQPQIDGGRFPIKRTLGETVVVTVDVFADGHYQVAGVLKYRRLAGRDPGSGIRDPEVHSSSDPGLRIPDPGSWHELPLAPIGNDGWARGVRRH